MSANDKIEERKRQNAPVLAAVDYLKLSRGMNQGEVCAILGTSSSLVSDYKSGKKMAGDEFKRRLIDAFGGKLNIPYLSGQSPYMLIEDAARADGMKDVPGGHSQIEDDLRAHIATLEELVETQRHLIANLRDRLRSLGVEYIVSPMAVGPRALNDAEESSLPMAAESPGDNTNVSPHKNKKSDN